MLLLLFILLIFTFFYTFSYVHAYILILGEKEKLILSLQTANDTISEIKHDNNVLKGKLTALELQFQAEKHSKETVSIVPV